MMDAKNRRPLAQGVDKKYTKTKGFAHVRLALLLALVLTAGILIWQMNIESNAALPKPNKVEQLQNATSSPQPPSGRSTREIAYDKDVQTLTALIENSTTDTQTRTHASGRLAQMVSDHQSELGIETALTQAGFRPCTVLMQNGALTVMVANEKLSDEQSVTILSLCAAHTDIGVENIRIMISEGV